MYLGRKYLWDNLFRPVVNGKDFLIGVEGALGKRLSEALHALALSGPAPLSHGTWTWHGVCISPLIQLPKVMGFLNS